MDNFEEFLYRTKHIINRDEYYNELIRKRSYIMDDYIMSITCEEYYHDEQEWFELINAWDEETFHSSLEE